MPVSYLDRALLIAQVMHRTTRTTLRRRHPAPTSLALLASITLAACGGATTVGDDPLDGENAGFGSGKADGLTPGSDEADAVLALVNDPEVDLEILDIDARLHKTAATNIINHRNGADGIVGTGDDDMFDDLAELDAIKFVGPAALSRLLEYAIAEGYLQTSDDDDDADKHIDAIFSPQPLDVAHTARVAELIADAEMTIDIAMYSFSNADISDALEDAVDRGVEVRFLFETANKDRKLDGSDLQNSKSGRLEEVGVDVRWVNKIMHHKFMIVDGPRDDATLADSAELVSGSANWSFGGATRYDENTLFMSGYPEMALSLQHEFDHLWNHSRELLANDDIETITGQLEITDTMLELADEDDQHVYFTSDNFDVSGDTFKKTGRNRVADEITEAIEAATDSIWVASGHLRHRGISEALMAKAADDPTIDIRVYLDAQEYVSATTHNIQVDKLEECLDDASTETQIRNCMDKGFRFGFQVGESGIDVRYKWYAQRWHFSYAEQMHHKYLIIDGDELWTGSFNLSDNAVHNTFENMFVFQGGEFAELIEMYEDNFDSVWNTGRDEDLLGQLRDEIETSDIFPIVFDSMALEHEEVRSLKALIVDRCPQVNSTEFRQNPQNHHVCEVN